MKHHSSSPKETKKIAKELISSLESPKMICLYGELGAGKTTFTKGIAQALNIPESDIKSPTYTFMRKYQQNGTVLYHFDMYRLSDIDDLTHSDLDEIFTLPDRWIVIEWPEKIAGILPPGHIRVEFQHHSEQAREITITRE